MGKRIVNGVEQIYTRVEIQKEVEKNVGYILGYIKEKEEYYADSGRFNQYETYQVLYHIDEEKCYMSRVGQGVTQDLCEDIETGVAVEVYKLETGHLGDSADEVCETEEEKEEYIKDYIERTVHIAIVTNEEREED